jgi:hypothetical protein
MKVIRDMQSIRTVLLLNSPFTNRGPPFVTVDGIVPAFLTACPALTPSWEEHLAFWEAETDRGIYNDVGIIADYLVACYEAGDLSDFAAAFAVLEKCLAEGDEETKQVTTIGIIEGIQTLASHHRFGPEAFERWLQPRSRVAWLIGAAAWGYEFALADLLREQLNSREQRFSMPDLQMVQWPEMREMVVRLFPQ